MIRLVSLALYLVLWPAALWADSDGYYCHGPGYVAWETRIGLGAPDHILHVVRFSAAAGIAPTQRIVLPEFQVHGMSCGSVALELIGWTTRYRVSLTDPTRPVVTSEAASFDGTKTPLPLSLGAGARSGITELSTAGGTGQFELVIARASRRVLGGIDHHVVARLVHRDAAPDTRIIASRVLMEGIFRETVDEN